jgi:prepilin-type N-terminal cleavage/methylation domain-containing protein
MKIHLSSSQRRVRNLRSQQSGLSILEVLIALAVLSIGLAGLAIMHMNSLQYAHSAYYRSIASAVALDLEERLWLRFADLDVLDCPETSSTGQAYIDLVATWRDREKLADDHWSGFSTTATQIRSLTITAGTLKKETFAEIPITLTWTDSRFDAPDEEVFLDEPDPESYTYTLRMLCKAASTGTLPPEV